MTLFIKKIEKQSHIEFKNTKNLFVFVSERCESMLKRATIFK